MTNKYLEKIASKTSNIHNMGKSVAHSYSTNRRSGDDIIGTISNIKDRVEVVNNVKDRLNTKKKKATKRTHRAF